MPYPPCPHTKKSCKKVLECLMKFEACRIDDREEITGEGALHHWHWNEALKPKFQKWLECHCPNASARQRTVDVLNKAPLPILMPWKLFQVMDEEARSGKLPIGQDAKYLNSILTGLGIKAKEDLERL